MGFYIIYELSIDHGYINYTKHCQFANYLCDLKECSGVYINRCNIRKLNLLPMRLKAQDVLVT